MGLSPRKIGEGLYEPLAAINVTPLVDVMLVLLIIFMVTAPMLATGIKVNLPSARTAQPLENKEPVVVGVAKDGAVSVGKDPVSRDELAARVKARLGDSNGVVQLRGDRDAPYGDVVSVMDDLAASGISRIAIVSGPRRPIAPASGSGARRAQAVIAATLDGRVFEPPPVRPPWLRPVVIAIVLALHAAALSIVYLEPRPVAPPPEIVVDIEPEAPAAENPTPPAEQSKPPEQSAPPPGQATASAPAEPPPVPVTPPVAAEPPPQEQPPPTPVEEPPPPQETPPPTPEKPPAPPQEQPPPPPQEQPPPPPQETPPPAPVEEPPPTPEQPAAPPQEEPPPPQEIPPPAPVELAPPPPPPKAVEARPARPPPPRPRAPAREAARPEARPEPRRRRAETGPGGIPLRRPGLARRAFDRRALQRRGERFVAFGL